MAEEYTQAALLNVVATPHPEGVYERLLRSAAYNVVQYWGSEHAAISPLRKVRNQDGFFDFSLSLWIEINPDEPTIRKEDLAKANFPREGREFSEAYGINGRVFTCVLDTQTHVITVELKNEDGKRLSAGRAELIFQNLLSPLVLGADAEDVEVTLIPQDDALDYVLGFNRLDRLEILVKLPNNDDITTETNRVLGRLREMNAKSEKSVLSRLAGTDGIEPDEEHQTLARVAAAGNGKVETVGLDEDGEKSERSTREKPKIVRYILQRGQSYLGAIRSVARQARDDHDPI
ncbi:DUF4747 family protein [Novosphingobium aquimarinum]|uniref:DUF4747 family protein n=1 Tax=Novosphingobium aquimarinum TaxID=2682494 RepID=UPI0012EB69B0|nr:DUF4747 family protein [Novosphingobium aquimarinum]